MPREKKGYGRKARRKRLVGKGLLEEAYENRLMGRAHRDRLVGFRSRKNLNGRVSYHSVEKTQRR
jgi:hypothetical protein